MSARFSPKPSAHADKAVRAPFMRFLNRPCGQVTKTRREHGETKQNQRRAVDVSDARRATGGFSREFEEETGLEPRGDFIELGAIKQKGGKIVHAWAFPGEWDEARLLQSNTFELEWPPRSGKIQRFPEIDRAGFFSIPHARQKLKEAQHPFLDRLQEALNLSAK
jgi:predicted NUDIX family NTP pyrophosphohydrolase